MTEYSIVGPPYWDDKPVFVVGNGPSIRGLDLDRLRKFHVLAVKGAIFDVPWAEAGFGLDIPRYLEWKGMLNTVSMPVYWAFPKLKFAGDDPHPSCVRFLRRIDSSFLTDDPKAVCSGGSSGFGALNLAWLKRAKIIVLVGFDYTHLKNQWWADERAYVSGRRQHENTWHAWSKNFDKVTRQLNDAGVKVLNASMRSLIKAFPKMTFDEALTAVGDDGPGEADLHRVRSQGGAGLHGGEGEHRAPPHAAHPGQAADAVASAAPGALLAAHGAAR